MCDRCSALGRRLRGLRRWRVRSRVTDVKTPLGEENAPADQLQAARDQAVQIQREAPTLNRGREWHILPTIYLELLPTRPSRAGSLDPHLSLTE